MDKYMAGIGVVALLLAVYFLYARGQPPVGFEITEAKVS